MAGDGDAGTGSMGAVPLRSAQMMGQQKKKKKKYIYIQGGLVSTLNAFLLNVFNSMGYLR